MSNNRDLDVFPRPFVPRSLAGGKVQSIQGLDESTVRGSWPGLLHPMCVCVCVF